MRPQARAARRLHQADGAARDAGREAGSAVRSAVSALLHLRPAARPAGKDSGARDPGVDKATPLRRGLPGWTKPGKRVRVEQAEIEVASAKRKAGKGAGAKSPRPRGARAAALALNPAKIRKLEKRAKRARRAAVRADRARRTAVAPPAAPLSAFGWLLLAGVILAWPRERTAAARLKDGLAEGPSGWLDRLRRAAATPVSAAETAAAAEPGRGRQAASPSEIPPAGWKDIALRTWTEFNEDRITAVAGGVTFFALLALFPAISAFVSLYGLFADRATVGEQLRLLSGVMPKEALGFVGDQMIRVAQAPQGALGLAFASSLLVSLWSANAGVKALFDGLNIAYDEREKRGFFGLTLVTLGFTAAAIAFLALALSAVVFIPVALDVLHLRGLGTGLWIDAMRWPLLLIVVTFSLAVVYRFGPSRAKPRWRWLTWGSALAAVLWLGASMLFSWYVASFGNYDKTYGSLGAVVGFLTWLWISIIIVLLGAELNSEIEHQTAVDTTTGRPQRMGTRGATVADTLGVATASLGRLVR